MADEELERLLAERDEIDRRVASRQQDAAVLFTDIVGSTELFERRGDLEGIAFIKRHNRLLFPVVEAHEGRVVKTIGDAIMACFEDPTQAVRCAAAMQQRLAEVRANEPDEIPIHIKVGVHAGKVMRDDDDVFGDAVNTAARVQGQAGKDEVLLSAALYERVGPAVGLDARPGGALPLKGKAEPLPVVSLVWGAEAPARDGASPTQDVDRPVKASALPELFVLEIAKAADGLKIAALDGRDDKGPVKSYAEVPLPAADLDAIAARMASFLAGSAGSYADRLGEAGGELFERALSKRARQRLVDTERTYLRLHVDDAVAHVPWELLHDGKAHLCLRFATGRVVSAREDGDGRPVAPGQGGGHAVVVSNPTGDLPESGREGDAVAGLLAEGYGGEVRHLKGPVNRETFLEALEGARLLHFAGHVSRDPDTGTAGFRLADGLITPDEAATRLGTTHTDLVFANACHANDASGWTDAARGTFDLASTLLMRGVRHYIGPIGAIDDGDALSFALRFYEEALVGTAFGEATRQGRQQLARQGSAPLSFARYVLYGEPRTVLPRDVAVLPPSRGTRSDPATPAFAAAEVPTDGVPVTAVAGSRPGPDSGDGSRGRTRTLVYALSGLAALGAAAWIANATFSDRTGGQPPLDVAAETEPAAAGDTTVRGDSDLGSEVARTGNVRIAVLDLQAVGGETDPHMTSRLRNTLNFALVGAEGIEVTDRPDFEQFAAELERGATMQIFDQPAFDEVRRAQVGHLRGVEVAIVGGFQQAGDRLRITANFVDVETGVVIDAVRLDGPAGEAHLFDLQDELAAQVVASLPRVRERLRP